MNTSIHVSLCIHTQLHTYMPNIKCFLRLFSMLFSDTGCLSEPNNSSRLTGQQITRIYFFLSCHPRPIMVLQIHGTIFRFYVYGSDPNSDPCVGKQEFYLLSNIPSFKLFCDGLNVHFHSGYITNSLQNWEQFICAQSHILISIFTSFSIHNLVTSSRRT